MHRFYRCPTLLLAALTAATFTTTSCVAVSAQDQSAPIASPAPVDATITAPASSGTVTTHHHAKKSHRSIRRHPRTATTKRTKTHTNSAQTVEMPTIPGRLGVRLKLGDGKQTWHPMRKQLGVSYAPGGSDNSKFGQFQFVVDRAALRSYLTKIAPYVRRAPVNAHPVIVPDSTIDGNSQQIPAKIVPDSPGAVLDVDAAVNTIAQSVAASPGTMHIVLPLKTKPAKVTAAALQGIDARIGYFVTRFSPSDVGRTQTVRRAINIINGHIIPPGQIFSVNQVVGERTAERGFGMGHVFIEGKMEKQLGGGMCQVATTLFNAAMLADLKIVERHQHVRTIPYAAPGRDATVYWGEKDFKIANKTDVAVYVSYVTTRNHAIVALFGKAVPGRKVELVNHYQRLGERHYTGVFYRIVHNPDGTVTKDPPFRSAYKWTPALDFSH